MVKRYKRTDWRLDSSRYDYEAQILDDDRAIIAALMGCDEEDIPTKLVEDSRKNIWVTSPDNELLRRFRRRQTR